MFERRRPPGSRAAGEAVLKRSLLAAALVLVAAASPAAAGNPTLSGLAVTRHGDDYLLSCRLVEGLSPAMLEEIEAGIETTLDYRLQVYRRRSGLPDTQVARRVVQCSVRHDALTRQYTLTRRVDGDLVESRVSPDPAEMRDFLTNLRNVPVARASELVTGEEYYVRARCDLGLVWRFYLIPWRLDTDWARITFTRPREEALDPGR